MLPKAHLTSHSRMSGSRWAITPSWLSRSWRSFLYSSSVYSCHLFLISSASVRSIPFLSFIEPIFAWNVPLVTLIFLKSWLIWKDPDAGKDWGQEAKGMTEDEMIGWHHRLNGHGFEWTLGVGDGQKVLRFMGSQRVGPHWVTELNWKSLDPVGGSGYGTLIVIVGGGF